VKDTIFELPKFRLGQGGRVRFSIIRAADAAVVQAKHSGDDITQFGWNADRSGASTVFSVRMVPHATTNVEGSGKIPNRPLQQNTSLDLTAIYYLGRYRAAPKFFGHIAPSSQVPELRLRTPVSYANHLRLFFLSRVCTF